MPGGERRLHADGGGSFLDRHAVRGSLSWTRAPGDLWVRCSPSRLLGWAGPRGPPPHFKGDCAADVRQRLVHSLARGLYFHNSVQCHGTGIGVSSPLTLSRPLSLRSPPRSLPPSLPPATAAFITARRREGGIAFAGSPAPRGSELPRTRGKQRQSQRRSPGTG